MASGCACSQAILSVYGRDFGLDPDIAMKLAAGFAGGMRMGETCGAVTGAFMVLGLAFSTEESDKKQGREQAYTKVTEFTDAFVSRNKTLACRDLLGCDITTAEGLKYAQEKGLFKTTCTQLVSDAAEILEKILRTAPS